MGHLLIFDLEDKAKAVEEENLKIRQGPKFATRAQLGRAFVEQWSQEGNVCRRSNWPTSFNTVTRAQKHRLPTERLTELGSNGFPVDLGFSLRENLGRQLGNEGGDFNFHDEV